jgi:hypothetical protein
MSAGLRNVQLVDIGLPTTRKNRKKSLLNYDNVIYMPRIKCYICKRIMRKDYTGYLYFSMGKAICPRCMAEAVTKPSKTIDIPEPPKLPTPQRTETITTPASIEKTSKKEEPAYEF